MDSPSGTKPIVMNWFKEHVGKVVSTPYFLSTATENYENTEITWRIKTLSNDSKGKDLRLITNNIYEKEVLFKRNSHFEIKAVDFQNGLVEMEEVSQTSSAIKLIRSNGL